MHCPLSLETTCDDPVRYKLLLQPFQKANCGRLRGVAFSFYNDGIQNVFAHLTVRSCSTLALGSSVGVVRVTL